MYECTLKSLQLPLTPTRIDHLLIWYDGIFTDFISLTHIQQHDEIVLHHDCLSPAALTKI